MLTPVNVRQLTPNEQVSGSSPLVGSLFFLNPEKLSNLLESERHPQPAWFYPFSEQEVNLV